MITFLKCYKAEFIKRKHTIFYPLHFIVPAMFIAGISFLVITRGNKIDRDYLTLFMFQGVSIAMPLLSSVICGLVCDNEASAGNCQNMITSLHGRVPVFLAQLAMLMTMCAFSIVLAVTGIMAIITVLGGNLSLSVSLCITISGKIWLCSIILYLVNLFLGYKMGMGICSMSGFLGVIIAALGTTRFFDNIWHYFPQSWAIRIATSILENLNLTFCDILKTVILTFAVFVLVIRWFKSWEGIKITD